MTWRFGDEDPSMNAEWHASLVRAVEAQLQTRFDVSALTYEQLEELHSALVKARIAANRNRRTK